MTFNELFNPAMGLGCAILITLLGVRLIEAFFFLVGFKVGQIKNRPKAATVGMDPVLLKKGVEEIMNEIMNRDAAFKVNPTPINPA